MGQEENVFEGVGKVSMNFHGKYICKVKNLEILDKMYPAQAMKSSPEQVLIHEWLK